MTSCRTVARFARLAGPLLGWLTLAGCDAVTSVPRHMAARDAVRLSSIEAAAAPVAELRPCKDPNLLPVTRAAAVQTAHEAGVKVALRRLPRTAPAGTRLAQVPRAAQGPLLAPAISSRAAASAGSARDAEPLSIEPDGYSNLVVTEDWDSDDTDDFAAPWPVAEHNAAAPQSGETEPLVPSIAPDEPSAPVRSAEMEAVRRQAEQHVRRGYALAARGAFFSARSEFIQSLRVISQALDTQAGETRRGKALQAGLLALKEAEDFVPRGSRLEADIDVAHIVSGHQTPVLKPLRKHPPQPLVAQQRYYTYAQDQLALAAGNEEAGSMALYSLGKIYGTMAERGAPRVVAAEPKSMVFHQAALEVDAGNYMAANELGVLLTRWGRYEQARDLLQHSVALSPTAAAWSNLESLHRRLGERDLAELARHEVLAAKQREGATGGREQRASTPADVQWVDADTFAATSQPSNDLQRPVSATSPLVPGTMPASAAVATPTTTDGDTATEPNTAQRPMMRWWPFTSQKAGPVKKRCPRRA